MQAVVYKRYGGVNVLKLEEVNKPKFSADQVLIRNWATLVNPMDWKIRRGQLRLLARR